MARAQDTGRLANIAMRSDDSGTHSDTVTSVPQQSRDVRRVRIVCVESDPTIYSMIERILISSSPAWSVGRYGTGAHALAALPTATPNVVLMSNELPDIAGIECANRLKRLVPKVHVVMCKLSR